MKEVLSILFLLCAGCAEAKIEWTFKGCDYDTFCLTNFSIGTPGQSFDTNFGVDTLADFDQNNNFILKCFGFWTLNKDIFDSGFDESASSTFNVVSNGDGYTTGADTIVIKAVDGSDQVFKSKWFNIIEGVDSPCDLYSYDGITAYLSFGYDKNGENEFFDRLLSDEKEKIAVILYNDTPVKNEYPFTGLLTFGERPNVCNERWTTVDTLKVNKPSQWSFNLDKFSVGKFSAAQPGVAFIDESDPDFILPDSIYSVVVDMLDINANENWIPCNTTQNFVFTVGGVDLVLTPDDYIVKDPTGKYCYFNGINAADEEVLDDNQFSIPFTLFRKRCLLFDLKKKKIAFADRTDK